RPPPGSPPLGAPPLCLIYRVSIDFHRGPGEGGAMGQLAVLALRAVIVTLLAGSLGVQAVLVPLLASDLEGLDAEYSYLRAPLLLIVALTALTAQTVLVCVWRLVTMARKGTVF